MGKKRQGDYKGRIPKYLSRVYIENGECKILVGKDGLVAVCDIEDYELVVGHHWYYGGPKGREHIHSNKAGVLARVVLGYTGDLLVDHADNNPLNNHKNNLRLATRSQNSWNQKKTSHIRTSKYKGVLFSATRDKPSRWCARICKDKVSRHLGYFMTEQEAARAYNKAAQELFGEFALLNAV
jgi:hypothetical protein